MNSYLLTVAVFLFAAIEGVYAGAGVEPSPLVVLLAPMGLSLGMCFWIRRKLREAGYPPAFDYLTLFFIGWPLLAPYYLFRIYRWKSLLYVLAFVLLWFGGQIAGQVLGISMNAS